MARATKRFGVTPALVLLLSCAASTPNDAARDAAVASVRRQHDAFVDAYRRGDVVALADLLDRTASLRIFHPVLEGSFDGYESAAGALVRMARLMQDAQWEEHSVAVHAAGDVAWVTSFMEVWSPQMPSTFSGRGTEVWVRQPAGWRMVHAHWSTNPDRALE